MNRIAEKCDGQVNMTMIKGMTIVVKVTYNQLPNVPSLELDSLCGIIWNKLVPLKVSVEAHEQHIVH